MSKYKILPIILILLILGLTNTMGAEAGPITIDIPATVFASPEDFLASYGDCLGNSQGSLPLYCNWLVATGATTYETLWAYLEREGCSAFGGTAEKRATILEFNISTIPNTAFISDVSLIMQVDSVYCSEATDPELQCSDMLSTTTRPSDRMVNSVNLSDALGGNLDDKDYFYGKPVPDTGEVSVHLNADGKTDFANQLDDDWFALGISICEFTESSGKSIVRFKPKGFQKIRVTYYSSMAITVRTDFEDGQLTIDDSLVVESPYIVSWHEDDLHVVNTDSVQTPGLGVKYLYRYWSDGGAKRHTVHISPDTLVYTAYFDTLFQLIIHAPGYTNPTPIHPDSVWFDPRSWANIDIEPDTIFLRADSLERHIFRGWNGVGSGSYTGPNNAASVQMNKPINQYAIYDTAYWLGLDYEGCGIGVPAQIGEGWVFVHDSVEAMTAESLEVEGAWYIFSHWSGSVGDLRDSTEARTWYVNPDLPRTIVAHYDVNPELEVFPDYMSIVAPGHYFLLPAIIDASVDYSVDSFRFTMNYNESKLDFVELINSSVLWAELTATPSASSVSVFGDVPGSVMDITPPETLFYYRMQARLDASGLDTITFDSFDYAFAGAETRPGYVNIVPLDIAITVTNDYGGDSVWIDGTAYPAPYSETWVGAEIHEIGSDTLNPISPGQMARFVGWSDSGARFHEVQPISDSTFTAKFDTLLYLDVVSTFGTPTGSGWFDRGEEPAFSVSPEIVVDGLSRDLFVEWDGVGTTAYSGSDNPASCTILTPIVETAVWQHQFWLELEFEGAGGAIPALTGEGWQDSGSWTPISTDSIVLDGATPYYFSWWSGGTVADRFTHSTEAFIDGIDTIVAIYSDVPFSFAFDVPETIIGAPSGVVDIPVAIDIPTLTELSEIGFNLYFDGLDLDYSGVLVGDLPWANLDGTDLSAGSSGHIYIHAQNPTGLDTDPGDGLCIIRLNIAPTASGESEIIASDGSFDVAVASPDSGIIDVCGAISATVSTAPIDGIVKVDSDFFASPFSASWGYALTHLIDVQSPQFPEAGVRITFTDWSDEGARAHDVSPISDTSFTANFDIDYRLQVISEHGVTSGSGWYSVGTEVPFSVDVDSVMDVGSYYLFDGWIGEGDSAYTGPVRAALAKIFEPCTETARWVAYHELTLDYASVPVDPLLTGDGFYDEATVAAISAPDSVFDGLDWYYFVYWSGAGAVSDRLSPDTYVAMHEPTNLTAVYSSSPSNKLFGPPAENYAVSGSYCRVPVIYYGETISADSIAFDIDFDPADISASSVIGDDFDWDEIELTGSAGSVNIYARNTAAFEIHDGDTLLSIIFYVLATSGVIPINFSDPDFDLTGAIPIDGTITISSSINVTVRTDFGGAVVVDGEYYGSDYSAEWPAGSEHQIAVAEYQRVGVGQRKYFDLWSDGGARSHYIAPVDDSIFVAVHEDRYYLFVESDLGVASGSGWFGSGERAEFSVQPTTTTVGGDRFTFAGWIGSGSGGYSGPDSISSVTMFAPIRETAEWNTEHYLGLSFTGTGGTAPTMSGAGWHDLGEWASITTSSSVVDPVTSTSYAFSHWTGGVFADSTDPSTSILMSSSTVAIAIYTGAGIDAADSLWTTVGETVSIPIYAISSAPVDLDTIELSITFGGGILELGDVMPCGIAWDFLDATSIDLGGGVVRVDIEAYRSTPFAVDGIDRLFCIEMTSTATGEAPFDVEVNRVHSHDFAAIGGDRVVVVSGVADITLASAVAENISLDGTIYLAGSVVPVPAGSPHIAVAPLIVPDAPGDRFRFDSWNDRPEREREIRPIADSTITALYSAQHSVSIYSEFGETFGGEWFFDGDTAICSIAPDSISVGDSIIYIFREWSGDYSGDENPCTLVIDAAKDIVAVWDTLYRVRVESEYGTSETNGWCAAGDSIMLRVRPTTVVDGGSRHLFTNWIGEGGGSYSGPDDSLWLHPASPIFETAEWQTQHMVMVFNGGRGTISGGGWFDEGDTAWFGITPTTIDSISGIRWVFDGWSGDGDDSYSGEEIDTFCTVNEPITETAAWMLEFQLTVTDGGHGIAYGSGWFASGDSAEFYIEPDSEMIHDGVAWRFIGWTGDGEGSYSGDDNPAQCLMDAPITEEAGWGIRYHITIVDSGASGIPEFDGDGWFARGSWQPISAPPIVISGSSRFSFMRWSGGTFDDPSSPTTLVEIDTTRVLTAHYSNFEISPPETTIVAAGDTFYVPITLYYPFYYSLMNIQFNLHFPHALVDFINVMESPDMSWSTLTPFPMGDGLITIYGNRSPIYVTPPTVLCIARFVSTGSEASIDSIYLSDFAHDISGANSNTGTLIIGAPIDVIVRTDYAGADAKVLIGGVQNSSPFEATWLAGEPHSIGALRYYNSGATRAAWRSWSDGGAIQHTIAPMLDDTFTANYGTEHCLTVEAPHGSQFGQGFYPEGDSAEFGLLDRTVIEGQTEYTLSAWSGAGTGHYSGPDNPARCRIDAPITETALYDIRHYLTVDGVYSDATGEGWFDEGWPTEFAVDETIIDVSDGTRRVFDGWSGAYSGPDNPATWNVISPNTETAEWSLEHLLTIETVRAAATGGGWHTSGDSFEISIDDAVDSITGVRWEFAGWIIGGDTIVDNPVEIAIAGPETARVIWELRFELEVISDHGLTDGGGWFADGESTEFSVDPETVTVGDSRFVFLGWIGTGDGSYDGIENPHSLSIIGPMTETALWRTQHYLHVDGGPSSATGEGWHNRASNASFSVTDPVIESEGIRRVFEWWFGFGDGSYTGAGNPAGCTMNGPILESAQFGTFYRMDVHSDHGTTFGGGYIRDGESEFFSVAPESVEIDGRLFVFNLWVGDGPGSYSGENIAAIAYPDSAIEEVAHWDTLFGLELASDSCGAADPLLESEGYFAAGWIDISAENPVFDGEDRYHFRAWRGGVFTDSLSADARIDLSSPDTAIAIYGSFEFSPADTTICSANDTIWVSMILHENLPLHWIDSIGFDIYYDGDLLTYYDISEDPDVDWDTKLAVPIARATDTGMRILAYSPIPIGVVPPETLLSVGFIVSAGAISTSPIEIESPVLDITGSGTIDGVVLRDNLVTVVVENVGFGDSVEVDGTMLPSPYSADWIPGDLHTISAGEYIDSGEGSRVRFDFWSDGDTRERTVWAESETTFSANFEQQYLFTVFNSGGDSPTPPVGGHWFDTGETVAAFVRNPDPITHWSCDGYIGTGDIFPGGSEDSVSFAITQPTIISWEWIEMLPLVVTSAHGDPWPPAGTTWFAPGTPIDAFNDSIDIYAPGEAWICTGYSGGESVGSGTESSVSFTIDEASSIDWSFDGPAYKLELASDGCGGASPAILGVEDFYIGDGDVVASFAVEHGGIGYFFDRWESIPDGALFISPGDTATTVDLAGLPRIAVARYSRGVRIDLFKSPAEDFGGFIAAGNIFEDTDHAIAWVPECWIGEIASTIEDTADCGDSMFVFDSWSDGGAAAHVVGPICEDTEFTANMDKRYRVRIVKDPAWDVFGTIRVDGTTYSGASSADATFWMTCGSSHEIFASEFDIDEIDRRLRWNSWSDGGARTHTIGPIDEPDSIVAFYGRQFLVTVEKSPAEEAGWIKFESTYYTGVSSASRWFDSGATANIEVSTPDGFADTLWVFDNWDGAGTDPAWAFGPVDTSYVLTANYSEEIVVLAFSLDTAAWRIGEVGLDYTVTMLPSENISLRNIGSHSLIFGLNVTDPGTWSAGYGSGIDRFALHAQFNDSPTAPATWEMVSDAVIEDLKWADEDIFGEGGFGIEIGSEENLWLKLETPYSSSTFGAHMVELSLIGHVYLP